MMKKILSVMVLLMLIFAKAQTDEMITRNAYQSYFEEAYRLYPNIPKGILEAVAETNTHLKHITHEKGEAESCSGVPFTYGVMGLTLDGKGHFNENLKKVAGLSQYSIEQIIDKPEINILAYAKAYNQLMVQKRINKKDDIGKHVSILIDLSEIPSNELYDNFAINSQLYSIYYFLNDSNNQKIFNFPQYQIDFHKIFGEENYRILSSPFIDMSEGKISNNEGSVFKIKNNVTNTSNTAKDYTAAIWNPTTCNFSSRNGTAISAVVVHTCQGTYAGTISWFKNCSSKVSAHYVIRSSDGQVTQMVKESDKAWHIGVENSYTIGIEHEGWIDNASWYTNAMYQSSANLVKNICSRLGINPLTTYFGPSCSGSGSTCGQPSCHRIKGHNQFSSQDHKDPGINWNWDKYFRLINTTTPTPTIYTSATGTFVDSGNSTGNYSSSEWKVYTIKPTGATSVTLNFTAFNLENVKDYIYIYNGNSLNSPLLGKYTGTTLPPSIVASSGMMTIEFHSTCDTTKPGWVANWTSNVVAATPSNDSCWNAITLTSNATCSYTTGTINGATTGWTPPKASCDNYDSGTMRDVWYKFVAKSKTHKITVVPTGFDAVIGLYNTCSDGEIGCADSGGGVGGAEVINASNLTVGKTYYIRVYNYGGTIPTNTSLKICVTHTTTGKGTNENNDDAQDIKDVTDIKVYPNPTSEIAYVEINFSEDTIANLSIFNISGKQVFNINKKFTSGKNIMPINTSELRLSSGVYFIHLNTNSTKQIKELIVK